MQLSRGNSGLSVLWFCPYGTEHRWLASFILLDFPGATKTKEWSSPRRYWRPGSASGTKTCRSRSQCTSGTVRRSRRHGRGKGTNPRGSAGTSESGKVRTLRAGEKRNPSVRSARNWKNLPGESDRRRVRAALRIRIRSEAADPLDWRDWRKHPGSVRAGSRPQARPLLHRRDRLAGRWPAGRHQRSRRGGT